MVIYCNAVSQSGLKSNNLIFTPLKFSPSRWSLLAHLRWVNTPTHPRRLAFYRGWIPVGLNRKYLGPRLWSTWHTNTSSSSIRMEKSDWLDNKSQWRRLVICYCLGSVWEWVGAEIYTPRTLITVPAAVWLSTMLVIYLAGKRLIMWKSFLLWAFVMTVYIFSSSSVPTSMWLKQIMQRGCGVFVLHKLYASKVMLDVPELHLVLQTVLNAYRSWSLLIQLNYWINIQHFSTNL